MTAAVSPLRRQPLEHPALVELAHLDRVIEDRSIAANVGAGSAAGDRHHCQIQLGSEPPVQAQLLFAAMLPALQSGEIQEAEVQRLLELVGVLAGEKDIGDVRFEVLDAPHRMRIGVRLRNARRNVRDRSLAWPRPPRNGRCATITQTGRRNPASPSLLSRGSMSLLDRQLLGRGTRLLRQRQLKNTVSVLRGRGRLVHIRTEREAAELRAVVALAADHLAVLLHVFLLLRFGGDRDLVALDRR